MTDEDRESMWDHYALGVDIPSLRHIEGLFQNYANSIRSLIRDKEITTWKSWNLEPKPLFAVNIIMYYEVLHIKFCAQCLIKLD